MEANKKLQRIPHEGAVAGVCAGLGEYFGVDKTWIRVAFILTILFAGQGIGFAGPVLYIIFWVVLPVKALSFSNDPFNVDYRVSGQASAEEPAYASALAAASPQASAPQQNRKRKKANDDRTTAGIILLGIGVFFLLMQFDLFHWRDIGQYWPVILILIGLVNIVMAFTGRKPMAEAYFEPVVAEASAPADETEPAGDEDAQDGGAPQNGDEPKN